MKKIGKGTYGTCYLLDDGETVRKYYDIESCIMPSTISQTIGIKNDTFIFPTKANFDDKYVDMSYAEGLDFVLVYPDGPIAIADPLIKHFKSCIGKVYDDARLLAKDKIKIDDMYSYNMVISIKNGITVFDTDLYHKSDREDLAYYNIREVNKAFNDCIFFPLEGVGIYDYEIAVKKMIMDSLNEKLKKLYVLSLSVKKGNDCYVSFLNELIRFLNIEPYGATLGNIRINTYERVRKL